MNSKGYMLVRTPPFRGRAWQRTGKADTPGRRSLESEEFSGVDVPQEEEFAEVWQDWSGGGGYPYRRPEHLGYRIFHDPITYDWAVNFDPRAPRELKHAQALQLLPDAQYSGGNQNISTFLDVPLRNAPAPVPGAGTVLALGANASGALAVALTPTSLSTIGSMFDMAIENPFLATVVGGFRGRAALFGSFAYAGTSAASGSFGERRHTGVWTNLGAHDPARNFQNAGNRLWRSHGNDGQAQVSNLAAGAIVTTDGNWSATYNIGNGYTSVEDLVSIDSQIFAGTAQGLFGADVSGTVLNVLAELKNQTHPDNCRDLTIYQGAVIAPHVAGIWAYNPNVQGPRAKSVSPRSVGGRTSPMSGRFRTVTAFADWVYAGLWTGSQSYIWAGRDASPGEPWVWHPMQQLPHVASAHRIHFDGVSAPSGSSVPIPGRMWIATDATIATSGTAPLYVAPVPRMNGNPLLPDIAFTPNYCGSARMDFGSTDRMAPGTPKLYRTVEVWADAMASGAQYCDVYYTIDAGVRTLLGRAQTSPMATLPFPATTGSFAIGQSIVLSLQSFTGSATFTPIYRGVVLRGALLPGSIDEITAVVKISDSVVDRRGTPMRPGANMLAELRALAAKGGSPVTLIDLTGGQSIVRLQPPIAEAELYSEGEDFPGVAATIKMSVLTFSQAA